ncbi:MAG: ribulose-phosphate 3-epimerase [Legionellales bacterium RIFCSPHIGHO2_12_FULL_37_14]|nr:MAG: ribulose-phosphate 3-epimerase [Legionellales bacterium RIFCSPHIGHO2_12_FULL_37_14]
MIKIAPSLLAANVLKLADEVQTVLTAGADFIHLDVMDQHYVPNLTFGPLFCQAIHESFKNLPIDVHLMVKPVHDLIKAFANGGAARISIHPDACTHLDRELNFIRSLNCKAGLALNPATSLDCLTYTHEILDFVLVMTVNPGFGGQKLIPHCVQKISAIKTQYKDLEIAVDGGVTKDNIGALAKAGASVFITGSSLFATSNYAKTISILKLHAEQKFITS